MLIFNVSESRNNMEDSRDADIVRMAMTQVERTLKDLGIRASEGYTIGYELGYVKGIVEHVLKTIPESQDKAAYMKGYVSGYIQGLFYSFRKGQNDKNGGELEQHSLSIKRE